MPRPARPWFRFYSEVLESRKVQRLKPPLFKHWINLMALANVTTPRGSLPPVEDIGFRLRLPESQVEEILEELVALALVDASDTGYTLHDWEEWQKDRDVAPDKRTNKTQVNHANGDETVSQITLPSPALYIEKEEERDKEKDEEKEKEEDEDRAPAHPFALTYVKEYERRNGGRRPSPVEHAAALQLERDFGSSACLQAGRDFEWQKHPNYLRPVLEERASKPAGAAAPKAAPQPSLRYEVTA